MNIQDEDGLTPLHRASGNGYTEIVRALLQAPNIDVNIQNDDGDTPLSLARERDKYRPFGPSGAAEIVLQLLEDAESRSREHDRRVRQRVGGADNPLTWDNWTTKLPGATDSALTLEKVSEIIGDSTMNLTKMYVDMARRGIRRGMENFLNNAQWFEVETDLKIIADRLGKSEEILLSYRRSKQCFQQSYLYGITDDRCFTIHGWATDIKLQFPTSHACLCAVLDLSLIHI